MADLPTACDFHLLGAKTGQVNFSIPETIILHVLKYERKAFSVRDEGGPALISLYFAVFTCRAKSCLYIPLFRSSSVPQKD